MIGRLMPRRSGTSTKGFPSRISARSKYTKSLEVKILAAPTAQAIQRGKRSRYRSMTADMAKLSKNHADIQKIERPVPPRHPVNRWCNISVGSDHFTMMTIREIISDHARYGITSVSQRRLNSKRSDLPYGTKKKPDKIKNKGIRHIDRSEEPSNDPEWPRTTMAMENRRSASI